MQSLQTVSILAVGVSPLPSEMPRFIDLVRAQSGRSALRILRTGKFDLLLAGREVPDMDLWTLIDRIRTTRPNQRWALVAENVSPGEEIKARSLGATIVLDELSDRVRLHRLAADLLKNRRSTDEPHTDAELSRMKLQLN